MAKKQTEQTGTIVSNDSSSAFEAYSRYKNHTVSKPEEGQKKTSGSTTNESVKKIPETKEVHAMDSSNFLLRLPGFYDPNNNKRVLAYSRLFRVNSLYGFLTTGKYAEVPESIQVVRFAGNAPKGYVVLEKTLTFVSRPADLGECATAIAKQANWLVAHHAIDDASFLRFMGNNEFFLTGDWRYDESIGVILRDIEFDNMEFLNILDEDDVDIEFPFPMENAEAERIVETNHAEIEPATKELMTVKK